MNSQNGYQYKIVVNGSFWEVVYVNETRQRL